ncbi:hypothetical protein PMNALOAF_3139 [Methylobacterium adhaesivum]|jgi:hypothetical protein|uniref:DUF1178 family protein n=1 Tax=Methylobacterium adhaesivum TaxID=333297 RepID=A0ABT8BKZ3_9HYPH|nr:DUF1178 family protein [Methylobacterium adhaesivum]MDN3592360.1 DUF1178 family protein [Methylobacterium adhaesivum]GJD31875.1 hypothetical protein PMNALOAF_3139 [Methylobacterium adhaesivum]
MIRYTLVCDGGHDFESWFPSSESYDEQAARGLVACPLCGSPKVVKGMMAPAVARTDRAEARPPVASAPETLPVPPPMPLLSEPEQRVRALMRAVREHVTRTADDVGTAFPEEARRMHYGESPTRPIYGEASLAEARALVEEGIEVAPLPPAADDRH